MIEDLKPLTSLRFFAAAMIVVLHAGNYFPWARVFAGYSLEYGVSFFFVLSGFILTHVYSVRSIEFTTFMFQRFARLWPVHLATLLFVIFFIRQDSQQLAGTGFFEPYLVLIVNFVLMHSIVPFQNYTFSWNSVSWSISTEVFFYLCFLWLLKNLIKYKSIYLLAAFSLILLYDVVVWIFDIPFSGPPTSLNLTFMTYASPLFRGFEFVLGMWSYLLWQAIRPSLAKPRLATLCEAAAIIVTLLAVLFLRGWMRPVSAVLPALGFWFSTAGACFFFALLIIACAGGAGGFGRLLGLRPMVWLGEISFALYMVHQPLMKWLFLEQLEGRMAPAGPLLVILVCLAAAAALHHLVELPARSALLWIGRRATAWAPAAS
jgi:peptidoglycan/LPS O-acetylase OafA/YrhL